MCIHAHNDTPRRRMSEAKESSDKRFQEHFGILSVNLHQCCTPEILVQVEHHLFRTARDSDKWDTVAYKASVELVGDTMIVQPNAPILGGNIVAKMTIMTHVDDDPDKTHAYDATYDVKNVRALFEHLENIRHAFNPSDLARDGCTILHVPGDWDKFPPTGAGNALSDAVIEKLKAETQSICNRLLHAMLEAGVRNIGERAVV